MLQGKLDKLLSQYPAVALVGPRQSGKTTLARLLSDNYYDLEQQVDRLRLDLEWDDITKNKQLVILDEAQTHPEVFPRLRGAIDKDRKRFGRFLLLGSISPELMTHVSESLAGRLAVLELTPFLFNELENANAKKNLWLYGGYPDGGILDKKAYPTWQQNYLTLLVQRDLPNWGLSARPQTTQRLISMLAASHSQQWIASEIGKSLGISYHTVNSYLGYLEGAFLIRRLPPFYARIHKRLTKRPKIYWRDSGLLHSILGASDSSNLLNKPWVGASWEGYVIEQIISSLSIDNTQMNASYLRPNDSYEIDLILEFASEFWAIEIKLTTRPSQEDFKKLNQAADLINADKRILISQSKEFIESKNGIACDLAGFLKYAGSKI